MDDRIETALLEQQNEPPKLVNVKLGVSTLPVSSVLKGEGDECGTPDCACHNDCYCESDG